MKKAIITPLVINLLIYIFFTGQESFLFPILFFASLGLSAALFVLLHLGVALFYYFYSDRNLANKERLINLSLYLFFGVAIVIPYLLYLTHGKF